ncbi:MAG: hypothetical protein AMQ22_02131 [Candidatus Methanofastidiosum methylothiophilum]|uniref:Uncharacterized protein n=1 Tax=Candidatus Methanofastidiosum methylothiophilum TaxID=1705564 RepID=A0A150IN65_9EURY|nr:MAG: hypothetical protein AMQ22_02131 [Candidatus Methanofastidiosum methylthiophilus]
MPLPPAYHEPMAILIALISSSDCSAITSNSFECADMKDSTPVAGDIGYPEIKLHPPASAPSATASLPEIRISLLISLENTSLFLTFTAIPDSTI